MTMSESPYTGYVEKWTDRFTRLMQCKARLANAETAYRQATSDLNDAIAELVVVQKDITVGMDEEIKEAPPQTPWGTRDG